jgi:hypothetical protein
MVGMKRLRILLILLLLIFALAACAEEVDDRVLPTMVELPALAQPTIAASAPTLPATWTEVPETATPTETETLTVTPSSTITYTPTRTATATPSETLEPHPLHILALLALEATILPDEFRPVQSITVTPAIGQSPQPPRGTVGCQFMPPGGFGQLTLRDPSLLDQLGCPVGAPPVTASRPSASQSFEHGAMAWIEGNPAHIYVLYNDGSFQRVIDTFNPSVDPENGGENPPSGLQEPVRGFGKVWRGTDGVRGRLGWGTTGEGAGTAVVQDFLNGRMIYLPSRGDVLILFHHNGAESGTWRAVAGQF